MDHDSHYDLVVKLRELGAVRVRVGDLEVEFPAAPPASPVVAPLRPLADMQEEMFGQGVKREDALFYSAGRR